MSFRMKKNKYFRSRLGNKYCVLLDKTFSYKNTRYIIRINEKGNLLIGSIVYIWKVGR